MNWEATNEAEQSLKPKLAAAKYEAATEVLKGLKPEQHDKVVQRIVGPLVEVSKAWIELFDLAQQLKDKDCGWREGVCELVPGLVELWGPPNAHSALAGFLQAAVKAGYIRIDHRYHEAPLGREEDGSLELFDDDVALSFRLHLGPGSLERLDGRSEASAAYVVQSSEMKKGIRHIKRAILFEISAVHVGSLRQSHCIIRSAGSVGPLAADARTNFAGDAAFTKVMAALKRLEQ